LILPCLGRTERDVRPATTTRPMIDQFVSCENSMGVVQGSRGTFAPASPNLMAETAIVCRMAHAVLVDRSTVDWLSWADDYDLVRDGIAKVIPGCDDYNARVRHPGGFTCRIRRARTSTARIAAKRISPSTRFPTTSSSRARSS